MSRALPSVPTRAFPHSLLEPALAVVTQVPRRESPIQVSRHPTPERKSCRAEMGTERGKPRGAVSSPSTYPATQSGLSEGPRRAPLRNFKQGDLAAEVADTLSPVSLNINREWSISLRLPGNSTSRFPNCPEKAGEGNRAQAGGLVSRPGLKLQVTRRRFLYGYLLLGSINLINVPTSLSLE